MRPSIPADVKSLPASLGSAQKTFTYDTQNNVTSVTDARGNVTTNTYDTAGNLTVVKLNSVQTAAYTYDTAGNVLTSIDGNGKTTTYTYDSNGNLSSVTDPLGNKTTYTYDATGNRLTETGPLGNATGGTPSDYTTTYTYDAAGNQLTETDSLGHSTTSTYDAAGRRLTTTDPNGHATTNSYDGDGHLLTVTGADPDGAGPLAAPVTTYTYDNAGNKLSETDPNNHTTTCTYDGSNRLLNKTTAEGNKTTYSYDINGNLASTTDPRGNVAGANPVDYTTTYTYDAAARKLTSTDPLGHTSTNTYDAAGEYNDPNGLYYLRARSYNPGDGRFTQVDPIVNRQAQRDLEGSYVYAGDRPTVFIDPTGATYEATTAVKATSRSIVSTDESPPDLAFDRSLSGAAGFRPTKFSTHRLSPKIYYGYFAGVGGAVEGTYKIGYGVNLDGRWADADAAYYPFSGPSLRSAYFNIRCSPGCGGAVSDFVAGREKFLSSFYVSRNGTFYLHYDLSFRVPDTKNRVYAPEQTIKFFCNGRVLGSAKCYLG